MTKNLRILIVDDSSNMRQIIMRYISKELNPVFLEAPNGEVAEKILQEGLLMEAPIDLIILDWMMPKMTGLELVQKIRSVEAFSKIPGIIMLTAETYADQINACMKYNISAYLTKPFTLDELNIGILKALKECGYAI